MKTIYHSMITYIAARGELNNLELAAICYPDAIRMYVPRHVSHFEKYQGGTSWMTYPLFMTNDKPPVEGVGCHDAGALNIDGALGGKTDIHEFEKHNRDMSVWMYKMIKIHLIQDTIFDKFIRERVDESKKADDIYYVRWGEKFMNAHELRKLLSIFEDELYPIIQDASLKILHKPLPFDDYKKVLSRSLDRIYPQELAKRTVSYMTMNEKIKTETDRRTYKKSELVLCYKYSADSMINEMIRETKKILKF